LSKPAARHPRYGFATLIGVASQLPPLSCQLKPYTASKLKQRTQNGQHPLISTTLETVMSKTNTENQNTTPAPLPVENENDGTNSEPDLESELTRAPTPNQATDPMIKNR
jgi:hypothetical protein